MINFTVTKQGIELSTESDNNSYIIQYSWEDKMTRLHQSKIVYAFPQSRLATKLNQTFADVSRLIIRLLDAHNNNHKQYFDDLYWTIQTFVKDKS